MENTIHLPLIINNSQYGEQRQTFNLEKRNRIDTLENNEFRNYDNSTFLNHSNIYSSQILGIQNYGSPTINKHSDLISKLSINQERNSNKKGIPNNIVKRKSHAINSNPSQRSKSLKGLIKRM